MPLQTLVVLFLLPLDEQAAKVVRITADSRIGRAKWETNDIEFLSMNKNGSGDYRDFYPMIKAKIGFALLVFTGSLKTWGL